MFVSLFLFTALLIGRVTGDVLKNVDREIDGLQVSIEDLENWCDAILNAINQGFVTSSDGATINLDETKGIDILGNIVEASNLSPNRDLYGNLHNFGHVLISVKFYSH